MQFELMVLRYFYPFFFSAEYQNSEKKDEYVFDYFYFTFEYDNFNLFEKIAIPIKLGLKIV